MLEMNSRKETLPLKIRVYAPGFCDYTFIDDDGYMTLAVGDTLNDVLKKLKVPLVYRRVLFTAVNYQREGLSYRLKDGDTISILGPLGGG